MKKYFLFSITAFLFQFANAQDTIVKINGDQVFGKITEISSTEVKYKKLNFMDGPTYVENKSEVKEIRYPNGLKDKFQVQETKNQSVETYVNNDYYNPNGVQVNSQKKMEPYGSRYKYDGRKIGEWEMQRVLMGTNNKQIIDLVQSAKDANKLQYIGFAAIPLGIAGLAFWASAVNPNNNSVNSGKMAAGGIMFIGAIACPIVSGVFKHKRKISNKKAVELYNQKY